MAGDNLQDNLQIVALRKENKRLRQELEIVKRTHLEHLAAKDEKLEESELRYHRLIENIPLGLYRRTCGPNGKLVMVNAALVAMFKYTSPEELNQVPVAQLYYHPEQCETFSQNLFTHKQVIKEQLKMKRKDGEPIWVAVSATVICDQQGQPVYFDGIMEDITAQKKAKEETELRNQQLMQADKLISLGVLVSGVAHEINNPNQFIVSHIAALKKTMHSALPILDKYYTENGDFILGGQKYSKRKNKISGMFKHIEDGTERIKHIVDELRDYAREHPTDLSETVYLNNVVKSSMSLLKNHLEKSVEAYYVTYGKEMPPFKGDYQRIEQVLINLIQNSCQAIQDKAGTISVVTWYNKQTNHLIAQVTDTGCGIEKHNLNHITDPFFTTKRDIGGTGLGLSICQTIIKRHGGKLDFVSEANKGTTVKMQLPSLIAVAETNKKGHSQ